MARKKAPPKKPVNHHPTARHRACPKCGTDTIAGYDNHVAATHQTLDVKPISEHEELAELKAGRQTFYLTHDQKIHARHLAANRYGQLELPRDHWTTVHRQHTCPPQPQQQNLF